MDKIQALESVKAFLKNDTDIETIIKVCDLYPAAYSWRKWTDNLGNHIQIYNNKRVKLFINHPNNKKYIITDLYFKLYPDKIAKMSTWAFISFGKDNKDILNTCLVWFLGEDNRLRSLSYSNNKWNPNHPPLLSGIDTLRQIVRNFNVVSYKQFDILKIKGPLPANITKSWATQWPPYEKLIKELILFNSKLGNVIANLMENK